MLYVLLGKSNSGKTTILNKLLQDKEFTSKVTELKSHTTRPMRSNEVNGREYIFDTVDQFTKYFRQDRILEYSKFDTVHGTWFYYTLKDDLIDGDMIKIIEPIGFAQLKQCVKDITSFYIDSDYDIRWERAIGRGDESKELARRFEADEKDFEYLRTDYTVNNNNENIDDKVKLIKNMILGGKNVY